MHACTKQHNLDWEAATVVAYEEHLIRRKVLESVHIREQTNKSNLDSGYTLSPIWTPLLTPTLLFRLYLLTLFSLFPHLGIQSLLN